MKKSWIFWLCFIIALVYGPFFGFRGIRMAGDEKVYVSQALEMAAHGRWFVQTLQGRPDYYKGPLHYLLIRVGLLLFGRNPWAVLYMNFLFLIAGALSVGAIVRRLAPKWNGGALWAGSFFATCVGVYTHAFASQMEVELACLFAIGLYLLERMDEAGEEEPGFLFWTLLGIIGWSKSPLHSVLGGTAAVLFWLLTGQLWPKLKSIRCWSAVMLGVGVCAAGYAPAYFLDRANFVSIYVIRETFAKGASEQSRWVSLVSVFGFYLFPWIFLSLVAYGEVLWNLITRALKNYPPAIRRAMLMSVCWMIPSCAFFAWIPYHFENYNLPVISGVILFVSLAIAHRSPKTDLLYRISAFVTAISLLVLPALWTALSLRFSPLPSWCPQWVVPFSWVATLSSVVSLAYWAWIGRLRPMGGIAIGMIGFYLSLGATLTIIGERELVDLRSYVRDSDARGEPVRRFGYYNLQYNIWSEWGFLNLWIDRPVYEIHDEATLKTALLAGEPVLVPDKEGCVEAFETFIHEDLAGAQILMSPWARWITQGRAPSGQTLWAEAWSKRDLSVLETHYYIARLATPKADAKKR